MSEFNGREDKKLAEAFANLPKDSDILPDKNGDFCWKCFVCGAIIKQKDKPDYCPFCEKSETHFFKVDPENL